MTCEVWAALSELSPSQSRGQDQVQGLGSETRKSSEERKPKEMFSCHHVILIPKQTKYSGTRKLSDISVSVCQSQRALKAHLSNAGNAGCCLTQDLPAQGHPNRSQGRALERSWFFVFLPEHTRAPSLGQQVLQGLPDLG